jgi:hypothetical protein
MREEATELSFGRYLAAKKAVAAYGLSEKFEEVYVQAVCVGYPRVSGVVPDVSLGQGGSMATQQPPIADEQSAEEIIWRVRTTLPLSYRVRLASRLSELQKAVQEEELDGRGISVGSLQRFIEFLEAYPALRCPAISVTPDRNIYTSWKSGSDRVFSIHFLPEGEVRFVIFRPNDKHPGQAIRLSGTATVDVIISIAAPHGVLNWASE